MGKRLTPRLTGDSMTVADRARSLLPRELRSLIRRGEYVGPTAGLAPGFVQANVVIIPHQAADDFETFCRLNPKPCPLLERTTPGKYEPVRSASGADLRTDVPRYRVLKNGLLVDRPTSIVDLWRDDLVAFLLGCSFTFENAMLAAGLPVRHLEEQKNVPMFRTNVECKPAGPFRGPMVVSMRPLAVHQVEPAARITGRFPEAHGAPVHVGNSTALGISDLHRPDYGDAVSIRDGEVPVFWACGVTPMVALLNAHLDLAITHEPGHMFVTDLPDDSLRHPEASS